MSVGGAQMKIRELGKTVHRVRPMLWPGTREDFTFDRTANSGSALKVVPRATWGTPWSNGRAASGQPV